MKFFLTIVPLFVAFAAADYTQQDLRSDVATYKQLCEDHRSVFPYICLISEDGPPSSPYQNFAYGLLGQGDQPNSEFSQS